MISIIIPTYNEAETIGEQVNYLKSLGGEKISEIIVVDGDSTDDTISEAEAAGAMVTSAPERGRGNQLNFGAKLAKEEILYFVHADSVPPPTFAHDITSAIEGGHEVGCYTYQFDSPKERLRWNANMTKRDWLICRGGDQTLFCTRRLFSDMKGFKRNFIIMEDFDFIRRVRKRYPFKIIQKDVVVSARKYKHNSYLRVNLANLTVYCMYFLGFSQRSLYKTYITLLNHPKA